MSGHECLGQFESRVARIELALCDGNDDGVQDVIDEVDGCAWCWYQTAMWAIHRLAGIRITQTGGNEAAAKVALAELVRLTNR
jgi:hypothetical protein